VPVEVVLSPPPAIEPKDEIAEHDAGYEPVNDRRKCSWTQRLPKLARTVM